MDIPSWAVTGAKVICVKDGDWVNPVRTDLPPVLPSFLQEYTISGVEHDWRMIGKLAVRLKEFGPDWAFALSAFQPPVKLEHEHETRVEEPV